MARKEDTYGELKNLGFRRVAFLEGRKLCLEVKLPNEPVVYVAVLNDEVFWVGETGNARRRFSEYRSWLSLPDGSTRRDLPARNQLLQMVGSNELVFLIKPAMTIRSELTGKDYAAHRVEEAVLIDHFKPAWNLRPRGRRRG